MRENAPAAPKQEYRNTENRKNKNKNYPGDFVVRVAAAVYYINNGYNARNLRKLINNS